MKMNVLLIVCGVVLLAFAFKFFAMGKIKGNSEITKKVFTITDYKEIMLEGNPQVIYEQEKSGLPHLEIEIDKNLVDLLDIKSGDGVLIIGNKKGFLPTKYIIRTGSTDLETVKAKGSLTMKLLGTLNTDKLNLSLTGNGEVACDNISCTLLTSNVSGKGTIMIKGKALRVENIISGNGIIDQFGMKAENVSCKISGNGNINVNVEQNLYVKILGGGNVTYVGNPKIQQSISGSGKLIKSH